MLEMPSTALAKEPTGDLNSESGQSVLDAFHTPLANRMTLWLIAPNERCFRHT
jgi:hypothetical protein